MAGDKLLQSQLERDMEIVEGYRKRLKAMSSRVGADEAMSLLDTGLTKLFVALCEAHTTAQQRVGRIYNNSTNFDRTK